MEDVVLSLLDVLGSERFVRVFWYFLLFEFTRYLVLDYVILVLYKIKRRNERHLREEARKKLYFTQPLISIIAPGKNEGENYYNLVRSLREQTYQNFEIILVDDGSDDESRTIGRDLQKNGLIDFFISNDFRGGKASAANLALKYCNGDYIVHIDVDCSFDNDAIENIVMPFFMDDKIGAVAGNIGVRNSRKNLVTSLQTIEYARTISIGRMVSSYLGLLRIVSGAFGAFRKDIMDRVGGWDIGPGLDGDLTVKTRKLGYKVAFEPTAMCLTNVPEKFRVLTRQRQRWNKSLIRFRLRKHINVFYANRGFRFINFLSAVENIFYNLVLNISWMLYVLDMLFNFTDILINYIVPLNFILYTSSSSLQFLAYMLISKDRKHKWYLLWYMPISSFYTGFYLRIVRSVAYVKEGFFFSSYKDAWNPQKTSKFAREMNI